ncbi:proton-conducting transporter transmembrane domain-containing protein [Mycolicibacterium palauense]|uniref:proton-conducting transporter transmembrane domain-containing protein n=1 Tax=Mycolicibacterium palauense TaxID=2034511 RepID=UPI000BFEB3C8|nr:proton-conducting transporter membrane subunit [Mycolicibacterium palauense]
MTALATTTPSPPHRRDRGGGSPGPAISGTATAAVGALGLWAGLLGMFGHPAPMRIDWLLPLAGVQITLDPLGGFFMALTGAVAVPVGLYTVGYARREHLGPVPLTVLPLFVAAMLLVPAAGTVTTLLYGWELMAVASLVLVLTEHRRAEVRSAALFYAVMTQLGFLMILVGLMIAVAITGSDRLTDLSALPPGVRNIVFVLTVTGFGSKAGLLPLHAWLPRAHPEAPSPVSALMSAAMVNLGIYGIVRVDLHLLGTPEYWWGLLLVVAGALSALYGVLQATVAVDLKRLLAYSTTENMGVISLALGASILLRDAGADSAAVVAVTAAALHLIAHAAFKCLAFLGAGSVLAATGLRDLDRLGGLAHRMPATTALFGIAALGASGLPLGAGFVSEWLLLQALVHGGSGHGPTLALVAPLAVGAIALTTGLGVAAMVKAFGIGFLARARSTAAAGAAEAGPAMVTGMALAAAACMCVAVVPAIVAPALAAMVGQVTAPDTATMVDFATTIRLPGLPGSISPTWLALTLAAAVAASAATLAWRSRRRPAPVELPLWACGAAELTPRMEYTATSFAEPLQRVFHDVLRPDTDIEISHHVESRYMVESISYRSRVSDAIERKVYAPVIAAVSALAELARRAHTGSVHLYLTLGALGVLVVMVVSR